MQKWYENPQLDENIILSSRVRLARNLKDFLFGLKITKDDQKQLIKTIKDAIINDRTSISNDFDFIEVDSLSDTDKLYLIENHTISPELAAKNGNTAVLAQKDGTINIMINEEDHIRIQTVFSGYNIEKAFELANKIDDLIEESVDYAFDDKLGYLTSCITNAGTGLRVSVMLHLPMLEKTGELRSIAQAIGKFGMTIRGTYGEGSESLGSIYQISNQITLGKTEEEIITILKNITNQIVQKEQVLRQNIIQKNKLEYTDKIYRSFGILQNCKLISSKEAMELLSDYLLGVQLGLIDKKVDTNIYNIMINIQVAHIAKQLINEDEQASRDVFRAKYLNQNLQ